MVKKTSVIAEEKHHERLVKVKSPSRRREQILRIIRENGRRKAVIGAKFNPVTGEGSVGERVPLHISDFPIPTQYVSKAMLREPIVKQIVKAGSIKAWLKEIGSQDYELDRLKVVEDLVRVRNRHDFPFWAATLASIKAKGGGDDILFRLNYAQRILVEELESMRLAGVPIRIVLLKARQWGGSTAIQLYMAWLQVVHKVGLNSLIAALQNSVADEILDMYSRFMKAYPVKMLHELGEEYKENEDKFVGVGKSGNIHRVPQRNCKIKIGSAERPDSVRGGDYNLVHCSEVGLWKKTEKRTPEQMVASACSGVLYKPYTMIVYESTANGTGNFFHKEYLAAKAGESQFRALFIPWYKIEQYTLDIEKLDKDSKIDALEQFAGWLWDNRMSEEVDSDRKESGYYLWGLWEQGATLEAINWYVHERAKYTNHASMASEYPSNDIEAFTFSGNRVFASEDVKKLLKTCRPPKMMGEIYGRGNEGEEALENIRIRKEENGRLWIWQDVERDEDEEISDRYLVVVDVCKGHTKRADYAVIAVFDRIYMMDGDKPSLVAQWYGHIDMDKLAWKSAQVAAYYNNALLVIESNTLETNNTKGDAEYILNLVRECYDNLYARKQSAEDIKKGAPRKYGYHTNTLTKKVIINNLKMVVREQLYTERDEGCVAEYLTYIETENGGFEAMEGYHDDKLMTRAIGMQVCINEMPLPTIVKKNKTVKRRKAVSAATI